MIEKLYSYYLKYPQIGTDTRSIIPNSIFFCLKGEHFDGNHFVEEALKKGVALVVTSKAEYVSNPKCFVVEDTAQVLQQLATYHRQQLQIPVIGITGTNGKTTTKELVVAVLQQKYNVAYTKGNLNNHFGVPLTLLSFTPQHEIGVVEMGANHHGEIDELCQIAQPNFGVVTNVGRAHLEGFGNFETIIDTKMGLYRAVKNNKGTLFVNMEDEILQKGLGTYPNNIGYGNISNTKYSAQVVSVNPFLELQVNEHRLSTHLIGSYNRLNLLAAITIGDYFKVPFPTIVEALSNYSPTNQRSQMEQRGSNSIIADYYNANPTSMRVALENLEEMEGVNKLAILGDMFELGKESPKEHQDIVTLCRKIKIPALFVGNCFFAERDHESDFFEDVSSLNQHLKTLSLENYLILLKGSRGIHLEKVELNF